MMAAAETWSPPRGRLPEVMELSSQSYLLNFIILCACIFLVTQNLIISSLFIKVFIISFIVAEIERK